MTKNKYMALVFLIFSMLCLYIAWSPVFYEHAWKGHDYFVHINRAYSTLNELSQGQFPPYFDWEYKDYPGYSSNLFYPPLSNYIITLLLYISLSPDDSVRFYAVVIIFISLATFFFSIKSVGVNSLRAAILSVGFASSIYVVNNIFTRTAFPESLAVCFIPLLIAGLYHGDYAKKIFLISSSMTLILLSNIPAALCASVLCFLHVILKKEIKVFIVSAIICLCLSMFFIFPLAYSMHDQGFSIVDTNWFGVMSYKKIGLYDLISGESSVDGPLKGMALGLGWPITFLLLMTIIKERKVSWEVYSILILSFVVISGANYNFLPNLMSSLSKIQFTWRFIPYILTITLFYIGIKSHATNKTMMLSFIACAVMASSVSAVKINSGNVTLESVKKVKFVDYVLTGRKENEVIRCEKDGVVYYPKFDFHREGGNNVVYSFNSYAGSWCSLPAMAYNSFSVKDLEYKTRDGMFIIKTKKEKTNATLKLKDSFRISMIFSYALSIISLFAMLVYLAIFRKRNI
ncbi:TPA: hypothetical protein L4J47_003663 [Enterobacter kobei]|nr:hypothetical protein [Enterobacter kobei]HBO1178677.1 hypothetical protein [Enterobacter kobei]HBO1181545.1 hypothetical protein [Enterobacter kobei]HBO2010138.1 hypothetical protein [Enterobacter kobei]HBO2416229.1 hypothetical protein [Enterobacter kobei]